MTITSNKTASANIQNNSLKREDIGNSDKIITIQNQQEQKEEPKNVNYSNFLGTNLDIKV